MYRPEGIDRVIVGRLGGAEVFFKMAARLPEVPGLEITESGDPVQFRKQLLDGTLSHDGLCVLYHIRILSSQIFDLSHVVKRFDSVADIVARCGCQVLPSPAFSAR